METFTFCNVNTGNTSLPSVLTSTGGGGGGGGGGDILVLLVCFEGLLTRPHTSYHYNNIYTCKWFITTTDCHLETDLRRLQLIPLSGKTIWFSPVFTQSLFM